MLYGDFFIAKITKDYEKQQYSYLFAAYGFEARKNALTRFMDRTSTCLDHVTSSYPTETETVRKSQSVEYLYWRLKKDTLGNSNMFRSPKILKSEEAFSLDQKL